MSNSSQLAAALVEAVSNLMPRFLEDPADREMSKGNAAFLVIDASGQIAGRVFGSDHNHGRSVFGIAQRKLTQVWITGYATGHFEELVYAKKLDDGPFGINRPDFIGWEGGVPLLTDDGQAMAAAFSGFRGHKDIEIIVKAVESVKGLRVKV